MSQPQVSVTVLPAHDEALSYTLSELRDFVTRLGRKAQLAPRAIYNLKLAVDEIATNIVMYAYDTGDDDKLLTVTAHLHEDRLIITLEDTGKPYDPRKRTMPDNLNSPLDTRELGGLGVYFALNSVDKFNYENTGSCNRNQFTMYRPAAAISPERSHYDVLLWGNAQTPPSMIHQALRRDGFQVDFQPEVNPLLNLLNQRPYDLLVIDASKDSESAFHLLKKLNTMSGQPDIPILIICDSSNTVTRGMELGATDFLHPPYDDKLLLLRVRCTVRQSIPAQRHQMRTISKHIKALLLPDDPALRFNRKMSIDAYLEHIVTQLQAIYRADMGKVYLRTSADVLRVAVVRVNSIKLAWGGTSGQPIEQPLVPLYDAVTGVPNHYHTVAHVAITGETINVTDLYKSDAFDYSDERWFDKQNDYISTSMLTIPLLDHTETVIGVIQLLNAQDEGGQVIAFDPAQQMLVEALCTHSAVVLSTYQLLQRQRRLVSIENDIKIGRRIQRDFMPQATPDLAGWQVAARFYPAREVAGDFYDIFTLDKFLVVMLADVADKGVGAALFMALIRSLLRAFIGQAHQDLLTLPISEQTAKALSTRLRKAVQDTNDYILQHHYNLNMFATLFIGIISMESGKLFHINAGHTPVPFLLRDAGGTVMRLRPTGPALGMFEDAWFEVIETQLSGGDVLFAYTDGLTDVRNHHGKLLSERTIQNIVRDAANQSMDELIARVSDQIFNQMGSDAQFDDMTFWGVLRERQTTSTR